MRPKPTRREFDELAEEWREDTAMLSSIKKQVEHPAYRQIIGMGQDAIPFIMRELRTQPEHWFVALRQIAGTDPVKPKHRGNVKLMARDWLKWWESRGRIC